MSTEGTPGDAVAWRAVEGRDAGFDGRFVFAVSSTGIYCRPSCPARRPRRDRVRFFARPVEAEQAGFRACRRCRPDAATPLAARLEQARRYLDAHPDERVTLASLARVVGGSPHHLQRTFTARFGVSPHQYAAARRLDRLRSALKRGDDVTMATQAAGYGSNSRMYEQARRGLGMNASTFRRGGRGQTIRFSTIDSPLGRLLLAATDRGVCAVRFGRSDAGLRADLQRDFPAATLRRDDAELSAWLHEVVALAGGAPGRVSRLPLDLQATAFEQRVFAALEGIPRGETRSYGEIAQELGAPGAARAVGQACGRNPVALLIPCHRVVRGDGSAGGYRWGARRKQRLLEAERDAG